MSLCVLYSTNPKILKCRNEFFSGEHESKAYAHFFCVGESNIGVGGGGGGWWWGGHMCSQ